MKIAIAAAIVLVLVLFYFYRQNPLKTKVYFNNQIIYTDVAVTSADKAKGLGQRESLPENEGMLFVFPNKDLHQFWMKDMRFPLDFVWLDGYQIVELTENVPVMTNGKTTVLVPKRHTDKVLEVNAGAIKRLGIKVGDTVVIRN